MKIETLQTATKNKPGLYRVYKGDDVTDYVADNKTILIETLQSFKQMKLDGEHPAPEIDACVVTHELLVLPPNDQDSFGLWGSYPKKRQRQLTERLEAVGLASKLDEMTEQEKCRFN